MAHDKHQRLSVITDEMISERAYQVWQSRGCPHGDGTTDWEIARQQIEQEHRGTMGPLRRIIARLRAPAA